MQLNSYEEINSCQTPSEVTGLKLTSYYFQKKESKIARFINLRNIACRFTTFFNTGLVEALKLPKLERLEINQGYLLDIPYSLTDAKGLKELDLAKNHLKEIPIFLRELKGLELLVLDQNKIEELDDVLLDLKKLKALFVNAYTGKQIPAFLLKLIPRLSELSLPKSLTNKLIKEQPELYDQLPYLCLHSALEKKWTQKLQRYFYEQETAWEQRAFFLNLLAANEKKIAEQADIEKTLDAINLPVAEPIRLKALEYLQRQIGPEVSDSLKDEASILVLGKLGINKNDLRQKLKALGIKYESDISPQTTHCLVGQMPGSLVYEAIGMGLPLLTEKYLLDYWEEIQNPYLIETVQEAPEQAENLAALLLSGQEESIYVALSMFKEGGFPKELITELFIAYQTLPLKSAARREAERLLRQYGSVELMNFLKQDYLFLVSDNTHTMRRRLSALNDKTELEGLKIAWYLYRNYKTGIAYLLSALPIEEAMALLRSDFMEKGILKLNRLGLTTIPAAVYSLGAEVEQLMLRTNGIKTIPNKIKQLTNLKILDLGGNWTLLKNGTAVTKLEQLIPNCRIKI